MSPPGLRRRCMLKLNLEYKDKYTFFFPVRWKHQLTEHHDVRSLKTNATKVHKKKKKQYLLYQFIQFMELWIILI